MGADLKSRFVAEDANGFVQIALHLGLDQNARQRARADILAAGRQLFENATDSADFAAALNSIAK
jgi:hypothetical protein